MKGPKSRNKTGRTEKKRRHVGRVYEMKTVEWAIKTEGDTRAE